MTEQEYQELMHHFEQMRAQGWDPQLCDTLVPHYDGRVPCGVPSDVGDVDEGDYIRLPRSVADVEAIFTLSVRGDSMRDAGIASGDELRVLSTPVVEDGDIVVALLDGEYTVKSLVTDERGQRWLVPANEKYRPTLLSESESSYILGRVVKIHHTPRRGSCTSLLSAVHKEQARRMPQVAVDFAEKATDAETRVFTPEFLRQAISVAYQGVKASSSDWIAVYKVLTTYADAPESFAAFAAWVNDLNVPSMPVCKANLLYKADPIYSKPLYRWLDCQSVRECVLRRRHAIAQNLKNSLVHDA